MALSQTTESCCEYVVGPSGEPGVSGDFWDQPSSQSNSHIHTTGKTIALTRRTFVAPGENARSWEALGEAHPGQSSLSAG